MDNRFPCTKCGLCCRHINLIPELAEYDTGNGTCKYLKDKLCSIYDHRPDICRVDIMYAQKYFRLFNKEDFIRQNLLVCKQLQVNAGLPVEIQVRIV